MNAPAKTEDFASIVPAGVFAETVLSVTHYTDRLFRFTMTRPQGFRFRSGEFAMIGLMVDGKPMLELPVVALEEVSQATIFGRAWDSVRLWMK